MNRRLLTYGCGCLLLAGLLLAGGFTYWEQRPMADAWVLDRMEQTLSDVVPGQKVSVSFRLTNTSRRSLRILGGDAC